MTDHIKIKPAHLQRDAFVYVRQSTPSQVEHNRESTERQYALANRAVELGWPRQQVFDRAGSIVRSPCCAQSCGLPLRTTASAPWLHLVSRLNTPPVCSPVNASPASLRTSPHDPRPSWLARPSM